MNRNQVVIKFFFICIIFFFIFFSESSYGFGWAYSLVQSGGSWLMGSSKEKKNSYPIENLDKELEKRLTEIPSEESPIKNDKYSSNELSLKKEDKEELKLLIEKS